MYIDVVLAEIGAKKIRMSDTRWRVSVREFSGGVCVEGNLEEFREVQPGVWEKWNIQNSGFQIYGYNGGNTIARHVKPPFSWYVFTSFYDAVDWIITGTIVPIGGEEVK